MLSQKLEEIFEIPDWEGPMNEEDIFYIQQSFFASHPGDLAIKLLLKKYHKGSEIVVQTLSLLYSDPALCNLSSFPYLVCVSAITSHPQCIEDLCNANPTLFINLLYRVVSKFYYSNLNEAIEYFEKLVDFGCAAKFLAENDVWGTKRKRVGVVTGTDLAFYRMVSNIDIDLTNQKAVMDTLIPLLVKGILPAGFEGMQANYSLSDIVSGVYVLPCWLDMVFYVTSSLLDKYNRIFPDSEIKGKPSVNSPLRLGIYHDSVSKALGRLLRNQDIKKKFISMVKNVCSQDRKKLVFDPVKNVTNEYAYNLYSVMLRLGNGAFCESYVERIGHNVFATFCFFYLLKLLNLSIFANSNYAEPREAQEVVAELFFKDKKELTKYLDFFYNVIRHNETKVYKKILEALNTTNTSVLDTHIDVIGISLEEKDPEVLEDLLHNENLIKIILQMEQFTLRQETPNMLRFFSRTFLYKNQNKTFCLRSIMNWTVNESVLIKRLIRYSTSVDEENRQGDRIRIGLLLCKKEVPIDQSTLRMINAMVSDLGEYTTQVLETLKSVLELRKKAKELDSFKQLPDSEINVSDEEDLQEPPRRVLSAFRGVSRDELVERVRALVPFVTDNEEINRNVDVIEQELLYYEKPNLYKLNRKLAKIKERLSRNESYVKGMLNNLEQLARSLVDWTAGNRRLFLNHNIFQRLCRIIDGVIYEVITSKLSQEKKLNFDPDNILRIVLAIVINLIGSASVLIQKSALNSSILRSATEIASKKYLFSDHNLRILDHIVAVLQTHSTKTEAEDNDVPDEFIDPLTYTFMENPVRLLTSRVTIDRSTFNQIMFSDRIDPFSRLPLDESMCEVDQDLLKAITEYRAKKNKKK